ncbi:MAG: hypothetical protein M1276_04895 [Deltaproteobacteria bacterium]|jgi:hypothetical protein|nr:hypothetical protein [Deltaproteobacteria bacterium]
MKNNNILKFKIAGEILIINKYILLVLLEKRENPVNIGHIFDRKVFLTSLFSRADATLDEKEFMAELKEKLADISESDKIIINILTERKEDAADKIAELRKISAAVKAYGII